MKVVILAGGLGTRLMEETIIRPKPMVEIGGKPMLWHIMNIYASHGFNDFIVACGYKGELIKEYFHNFVIHSSDYVIDMRDGSREVLNASKENWRVAAIDTGATTMTGGRLRRLKQWIGDETFLVTYGDGVGNIDIGELVKFHRAHGKIATVTAVRPPARFGTLLLDGDKVSEFSEKPQVGEGWINGGFFVLEPSVFDCIDSDETSFEREPLERLARSGNLMARRHEGFWHPLDTMRDRQLLESMWEKGDAPWKVWK
jgi:glucose-1-phosphate cytidylyltransferase